MLGTDVIQTSVNYGSSNISIKPTSFEPETRSKSRRYITLAVVRGLMLVASLGVALVLWFLFTAKAVRFESNAADVEVEISGGIVIPSGAAFLMRPGNYQVALRAPGYVSKNLTINVNDDESQVVQLELQANPGIVSITSIPAGANVVRDGVSLGTTPIETRLPPGDVHLEFAADRYLPTTLDAEILGRDQAQTLSVILEPNWGFVTVRTQPTSARFYINGEATRFYTPGPVEVMSGEHELSIKSPGYELWTDLVFVKAGESQTLEPVTLKLVGGTLNIATQPAGASITIDGSYEGEAPLTIDIPPNRVHRVEARLFGYKQVTRNVSVETASERNLQLSMQQELGELAVETQPEEVEIWIDNENHGLSNRTLTLHAVEHDIELRKDGYASYTKSIVVQPNLRQEVKVRLLTDEEARLEALKQVRTTFDGQELVLLQPNTITLGASRRQPGRRANEVFRTAELKRLFYLGVHEVTNKHYKDFASEHLSGSFQGMSLDKDNQPVVNISWREAILYCNWLSSKEGFEPFYRLEMDDDETIVPEVNRNSLGYRLPTEAEWTWAARYVDADSHLLLFPWGDQLPPPQKHGNYADQAAQHVIGRVIFDYNDNYIVPAPVGTFKRNTKGIHDLGGNVAEWTHDFYSIPTVNSKISPMGPSTGEFHVIKGSSYMHGTITDLRLSFRDYGIEGKRDLGFRIARFAE